MPKRTKDQDKHHAEGFAAGIAVAAAIAFGTHDDSVIAEEILGAANMLDRATAKKKGADDYDLKILKPAFARIRAKRRP